MKILNDFSHLVLNQMKFGPCQNRRPSWGGARSIDLRDHRETFLALTKSVFFYEILDQFQTIGYCMS